MKITNTGAGQWRDIDTKGEEFGIDVFPLLPIIHGATCDEVCVWYGHGWEGVASRRPLKVFLEGELNDLIISWHGEAVLEEVLSFVKFLLENGDKS